MIEFIAFRADFSRNFQLTFLVPHFPFLYFRALHFPCVTFSSLTFRLHFRHDALCTNCSFTSLVSLSKHTHRFNGHFPGKPGLPGCLLDFQSPVILILSILSGQVETISMFLMYTDRFNCLSLLLLLRTPSSKMPKTP